MGHVRINIPNQHSVYMHDTPHRELFATNDRWESSGCVRVDKVKNLITWVMNGNAGMNPVFRWFGLFMDKMVGPDFDAGLKNLKKLAEAT